MTIATITVVAPLTLSAEDQSSTVTPPPPVPAVEDVHPGQTTVDQVFTSTPTPVVASSDSFPHEGNDCVQAAPQPCCEDEADCCCLFSDKPLLGCLKNVPLDCCSGGCSPWVFSFGGEIRYRYMDENNRLRPAGNTTRNTYDLYRWRNYVELYHGDDFGLHVEMIDASSFDENLPPLGIDDNQLDFLQAYADLKIGERNGKPIIIRGGRQFF